MPWLWRPWKLLAPVYFLAPTASAQVPRLQARTVMRPRSRTTAGAALAGTYMFYSQSLHECTPLLSTDSDVYSQSLHECNLFMIFRFLCRFQSSEEPDDDHDDASNQSGPETGEDSREVQRLKNEVERLELRQNSSLVCGPKHALPTYYVVHFLCKRTNPWPVRDDWDRQRMRLSCIVLY